MSETSFDNDAAHLAESAMRQAIESADLGYWSIDPRTLRVEANRRTQQLFGLPPDGEVDLHFATQAIYSEDRERVVAAINRALTDPTASAYDIEYRVMQHGVGLRFVRATGKSYFDAVGRCTRFSGIIQDVSEQKTAETALRASEQRFQAAVQAVQGIVWTNDATGQMVGEQPGWSALTGQRYEEYQGFGWSSAVHPDDVAPTVAAWGEAVHQRRKFVFEHRVRRKDGTYGVFSIQAIPVFSADGRISEWVGVHTDISERRAAEEALNEARARQEETLALLESMLQYAPIGFAFFDRQYRYLRINETLAAINGVPVETHIGRTVHEVLTDRAPHIYQIIDEVFTTGKPVPKLELSGETPLQPGVQRWWHTGFYPVINERTRVVESVGIVVMEITDLKQAETALRLSEEQMRLQADFMPQIVWATDGRGYHDFYNKRWYEYTGLSYDITRGEGWAGVLHPDDAARTWQVWKHCLETGDYYEVEYRMRRYDGVYRWLLARATPIRNEEGEIVRWFGTCTDIHDQKTFAETLEHLVAERTAALQRSNEDLQQFAHVASHDLKEPVRKIATFESRISGEFGELLPPRAKGYLEKIRNASRRMYAMIDGVLRYSSVNEGEQKGFEQVSLDSIVMQIRSDLEVLIDEKHAVIECGPLPEIYGSPTLLHQLLYNILNNALKFVEPQQPPRITLNAGSVVLDGKPFVHLRVADNGIGFDPAQARQIFKTFTRLNPKDHYEGTGLGLSLCEKIVNRHGGRIYAEGQRGAGAVFHIYLPEATPLSD